MKSIVTLLALCLGSLAQAATIVNHFEIYPYSDYYTPSGYAVSYHGYPDAMLSLVSGSTYQFTARGLAEEFAFYEVKVGDLINQAFRDSSTALISNNFGPNVATISIPVFGGKYLGYWARADWDGGEWRSNHYGWVRIVRTSSGLAASASATSTGNGIHVGSFSEVPEPSTSLLALLVAVPLVRRKRLATITF